MTLLAPLCKAWKRLSCLLPAACSCATSFFRAAATSSPASSSSLLVPSWSSNFEHKNTSAHSARTETEALQCKDWSFPCRQDCPKGLCMSRNKAPPCTHLLGPVQIFGVLVEQVEGLGRALPLVHVACDQDPLHAHLQFPGALPPFALVSGAVSLLAPLFGVAGCSRHVSRSFGGEKSERS